MAHAGRTRRAGGHRPAGLGAERGKAGSHCTGLYGGTGEDEGKAMVNVLPGRLGGHVWMHGRCHAPWMKRGRAEAEAALAALGVKP